MKVEPWITGLKRMKLCQSQWASPIHISSLYLFFHFEVVVYVNQRLIFEIVPPTIR